MTDVVSLKGRIHQYGPSLEHAPAELLYVGRPQTMGGWKLPGHPLRNPHKVRDGVTPEEAVTSYARHLAQRPQLLALVGQLRARTLACWCAPSLCHAHLLAHLADTPHPPRALDTWLAAGADTAQLTR